MTTGVRPDEASYFARGLARSVLDGTAPFGAVDPETEHGKELAAFVAELDPAAEAAATRWAEQAHA